MMTFNMKKLMVTVLAALSLLLLAEIAVEGVQAAEGKQQASPKRHKLAATLETTQWGWLDPNEPPKLTVDSGDIVSIETMMHSHDKIQPGVSMDEIVALRKANPGGGPHSLTGPIFVNGAEPGDVMEIRILKIEPKRFGFNFNLPGKEFPTILRRARAGLKIRWRRSQRFGLGRTARTWTSTSFRKEAPFSSRSFSRAAWYGPVTRIAARGMAKSI